MPDGWHRNTPSSEACALLCVLRPACVYITRWHDSGDCLLSGAGATTSGTTVTTTHNVTATVTTRHHQPATRSSYMVGVS